MAKDKDEHTKAWSAAAYHWAEVSADFAEACAVLAELTWEAVDHTPDELSDAAPLREFATRLDEWAANARRDALDIGELAAALRRQADVEPPDVAT